MGRAGRKRHVVLEGSGFSRSHGFFLPLKRLRSLTTAKGQLSPDRHQHQVVEIQAAVYADHRQVV
jgi:hypothetical protein